MTTRILFSTPQNEVRRHSPKLIAGLPNAFPRNASADPAGQRWSRDHGYRGYTSYASLDDLPRRDPAFAELKRRLEKSARAFAAELAWSVRPRLDSLWVNLLRGGGHHTAHIHPHSILSGTLYVEAPAGSGAIRFEDPRLPMMMAAPVRTDDAPEALRAFVSVVP